MGLAESMLMVTAIVNIHHFIVDRFIWRLRRPDNVQTMTGATAPSAIQVSASRA